jgi:hypothetical protein
LEIALNPSVEARLFVFSECRDLRHQFEKLLARGGSQAAASSIHVTALGHRSAARRLSARDPGQPLGDGLVGAVEARENTRPVSPTLSATMAPSERSRSGASGSGRLAPSSRLSRLNLSPPRATGSACRAASRRGRVCEG